MKVPEPEEGRIVNPGRKERSAMKGRRNKHPRPKPHRNDLCLWGKGAVREKQKKNVWWNERVPASGGGHTHLQKQKTIQSL